MTQEQYVDDLDLIGDVPAGGGVFKNFGKLNITQRFIAWANKQPTDVKADVWKALGKGERGMDIVFGVDVQEFNSALQFSYERKVRVNGPDWYKTLVPSIEAILGKGAMVEGDAAKNIADKRSATLRSLKGKYVCVEDAPPQKLPADPNAKVYHTIKFVKVYDTREACYNEWKALSGNSASANGTQPALDANVPPDFAPADWYGLKGELQEAVSKALSEAQKKPKPIREKAMGEAKEATLAKYAGDWSATIAQIENLLNS